MPPPVLQHSMTSSSSTLHTGFQGLQHGPIGRSFTGLNNASQPQFDNIKEGSGSLLLDEIKGEVKRIVPVLSGDGWKGMSGKVGVLGGCSEYTGSPYFTAMAALKVGADLSHVFTTKDAAQTVRAYSPEIIVHPYFPESTDYKAGELSDEARAGVIEEAVYEVAGWFTRLDCLVVGPGLGRDPLLLDIARACILAARGARLPLVLDGDGLFLVAREPELVQGYPSCVLTPNLNEFRRLASTMGVSLHGPHNDRLKKLAEITAQLGGPVVVSKGPVDAIHDGKVAVLCSTSAGLRRCGGQGDILAGAIATFVSWVASFMERAQVAGDSLPDMNPMVLACFGGCLVTRTASALAFSTHQRAMLAGDMLAQLGPAVSDLFDAHHAPGMDMRAMSGPTLARQDI